MQSAEKWTASPAGPTGGVPEEVIPEPGPGRGRGAEQTSPKSTEEKGVPGRGTSVCQGGGVQPGWTRKGPQGHVVVERPSGKGSWAPTKGLDLMLQVEETPGTLPYLFYGAGVRGETHKSTER